jgi:hypothetical protein
MDEQAARFNEADVFVAFCAAALAVRMMFWPVAVTFMVPNRFDAPGGAVRALRVAAMSFAAGSGGRSLESQRDPFLGRRATASQGHLCRHRCQAGSTG